MTSKMMKAIRTLFILAGIGLSSVIGIGFIRKWRCGRKASKTN